MTTETTTQPRPGYAGVTVWIGDESITRYVPEEAFEKLYMDPLAALFADANADLRNAHLWGAPQSENRPANVRTCLPAVQRIDTSPERVEETAKRDHEDVELPHPLGIVDPYPSAPLAYTVQDFVNYARAAVLADRQQRDGEDDGALTVAYLAGAQAEKERQQRGGVASIPAGWSLRVHADDDRVWLEMNTPDGASAAMSVARLDGSGHETVAAQVLAYLGDALAAAAVQKPVEGDAIHRLIAGKFISGNAIPVEHITITRAEYDAIAQQGKEE